MAELPNNKLTYQQFQGATVKDLEENPQLLQAYGKAWGADPSRLLSYWKSGYRSFDADKSYLLGDRGINSQFREGSELSYNLQRYGNWNNAQNPADQRSAFAEREKGLAALEAAKKPYIDLGIDPESVPQFAQYLSQFGATPGAGVTSQQAAGMPQFGGMAESPLGRKLGPSEFSELRMKLGVSESNFGDYFNRDSQGNIYLKPKDAKDQRQPGESVADFTKRLEEPQFNRDGLTMEQANDPKYWKDGKYVGPQGAAGAAGTGATGTTGPTQTSDSVRADIAKRIREELMPKGAAPEAPSTAEERIRLRREQGVMSDEQDLNDLRNDYRMAQEELRVFKSRAGQGVSEGGRLGAVSEAERNLSFRLEGLALREQALVERVNSKNAYINQTIQDRQADYTNALNKWNSEFAVNSKVSELANAQMDDIQKDAIATVTTITNLMKESNTPYDQWSPEMRMQVESAALKAGLPKDLFKTVYSSMKKDEKILETKFVTNASGGTDVYNVVQDKAGNVSVVKATGSIPVGLTDEKVETEVVDLGGKKVLINSKTGAVIKELDVYDKDAAKKVAEEQQKSLAAMEKVKLIDSLLTSKGLTGAVGSNWLGRLSVPGVQGDIQTFNAGLAQLVSQDTLNALLNLKAQGGMLGALNESEGQMLRNSASRLNSWITSDKNGKITAVKAPEKDFKDELNRIKGLTLKALAVAEGSLSPTDTTFDLSTKEGLDKFLDSYAGKDLSSPEAIDSFLDSIGPKADGGAGAAEIRPLSIGGRTVKVSSAIADRLAAADADFFAATGQHFKINEGYRTRERQAELYDKSKRGEIGRAAPPGKSFHETGLAVDVQNWKAAEPYLRKYGLRNDLADDRNHFSFGETG